MRAIEVTKTPMGLELTSKNYCPARSLETLKRQIQESNVIETTPAETTWKCDRVNCMERGGIMSGSGAFCQSEDYKNCPYYDLEDRE